MTGPKPETWQLFGNIRVNRIKLKLIDVVEWWGKIGFSKLLDVATHCSY